MRKAALKGQVSRPFSASRSFQSAIGRLWRRAGPRLRWRLKRAGRVTTGCGAVAQGSRTTEREVLRSPSLGKDNERAGERQLQADGRPEEVQFQPAQLCFGLRHRQGRRSLFPWGSPAMEERRCEGGGRKEEFSVCLE
uniref:Uncharacterized protein n=1 Tax=Sphaerodactylus townsendi TaxID=933632 RepID=A0ACB8FMP6_9SAUR